MLNSECDFLGKNDLQLRAVTCAEDELCDKNGKKGEEKQGQYVACTVQENVFSWDIWLHQLEFLYCCCNKWLQS